MLDEKFCPQLNITYKCNLNCSYCYEQEFSYKKEIMSLEEIGNLFRLFKSLNIHESTLIGGEPTLHPDLSKICSLASEKNISLRIFTSGFINKKILNLLKESESLRDIYIHLTDHINRQWSENISELFKASKNIWFRINFSNVHEIKKAESIISKFKSKNFKIGYSLSCPYSRKDKTFIPVAPRNRQVKDIYKKLFDFLKTCIKYGIEVHPGRPLPLCQYTEKEWDYLVKNANAKSTCNPINDINFDPGYYIKLCSVIKQPRYKLNVLDEEHFKRILKKLLIFKRTTVRIPSMNNCSSCVMFPEICQGGCYAHKIYKAI